MKKNNNLIEHVRIQARGFYFKIYAEMLDGCPENPDFETQVRLLKEFAERMIHADSAYFIHAIVHDKDMTAPTPDKPKKPHYNIFSGCCQCAMFTNIMPHFWGICIYLIFRGDCPLAPPHS